MGFSGLGDAGKGKNVTRPATRRANAQKRATTKAVANTKATNRRGRPTTAAVVIRFDNPAILAAAVAAVDAAILAGAPEMPAMPTPDTDGTIAAVELENFRDAMLAYPANVAQHNAERAILRAAAAALAAPKAVSRKAN